MSKAWSRMILDAGLARLATRRSELLARQNELMDSAVPGEVDMDAGCELRSIAHELYKLDQRQSYCERMKGTVQ